MTAPQNPYLVPVKYGTGLSVLNIVAGGLLLLLGVLALLGGRFSFWLVLGPLLLAMGILSLTRPYATYDTATGALDLFHPFGYRMRSYGAPKGERIYFDPAKSKIMRARQSGGPRKVSMVGMNRDDLARLIAVLPQA
ncbi:hypothetical protein [Glycomyces tritici]|uniref:Uncharacterized protein n=1 Tax=Glycomyces tritici TaxID=2665176 RepID=A0ABT7YIK8_9ACTN|nr:hypothetical protein [Glycomyces tritici]MDN3238462.1 hypothetical protein [Glycomyces tritici]